MITRSGASTVAELCLTKRPCILIPFAAALEGDQTHNARHLESQEAAKVLLEKDFTPERLATMIEELISSPQALMKLSSAARTLAKPNASSSLVNYIAEYL